MKRNAYPFVSIVILILMLVSCKHYGILENVQVIEAEPQTVLYIERDTTFVSSLPELLDVVQIQIVNDTILLVQQNLTKANGCHYIAYSTANFKVLDSLIYNGRGPNEMLHPHMAKSTVDYLCLNLNSEQKAYMVDVQKTIKSGEVVIQNEFNLPSGIIDWVPVSETRHFMMLDYSCPSFTVLDQFGDKLHTFKLSEPIIGEQSIPYLSSVLTSGGRYVAQVMFFFPLVNIFDVNTGKTMSISTNLKYRNWKSVLFEPMSLSSVQYYSTATATSELLFLSYNERELSGKSMGDSSIQVFNWSGQFKYEFKIKEHIYAMTYDDVNGYLYCCERATGTLIRYDLSQYDL